MIYQKIKKNQVFLNTTIIEVIYYDKKDTKNKHT